METTPKTCEALHNFSETHIGEDCKALSGTHEKKLFFECEFDNLNNLTLKDCELNGSKFTTDEIAKALNFTLTLNCASFSNVEYSPLLFDLFLLMLFKSKGNDEKRMKLLDVIGRERTEKLLRLLSFLER